MRSPVSWALLGLVIQRPSYGYELVQRFERTYGDALELSSPSQVYTALDSLSRRALIETMPAQELGREQGRQPKPHYRATADGVCGYEQWLIHQMGQQRRRSRMFAQQLAMLAPSAALRVLDHCEQEVLAKARGLPARRPAGELGQAQGPGQGELAERLVAEEDRLTIDAKLAWIQYARLQLNGRAPGTAPLRGRARARGPSN